MSMQRPANPAMQRLGHRIRRFADRLWPRHTDAEGRDSRSDRIQDGGEFVTLVGIRSLIPDFIWFNDHRLALANVVNLNRIILFDGPSGVLIHRLPSNSVACIPVDDLRGCAFASIGRRIEGKQTSQVVDRRIFLPDSSCAYASLPSHPGATTMRTALFRRPEHLLDRNRTIFSHIRDCGLKWRFH